MSAGYSYRALIDESRVIITQMGTHNKSEEVTVYGTPCAIPPLNRIRNNSILDRKGETEM
jgi:hypothetical protein